MGSAQSSIAHAQRKTHHYYGNSPDDSKTCGFKQVGHRSQKQHKTQTRRVWFVTLQKQSDSTNMNTGCVLLTRSSTLHWSRYIPKAKIVKYQCFKAGSWCFNHLFLWCTHSTKCARMHIFVSQGLGCSWPQSGKSLEQPCLSTDSKGSAIQKPGNAKTFSEDRWCPKIEKLKRYA
jgi:hypothetical protein